MSSPPGIKFDVKTLLGALSFLIFVLFIVVSIPVYIYRYIITSLAKYFCPFDIVEIMDSQSAYFVEDYFGTGPPRSNIVLTLSCTGNYSVDDVKRQVLNRWIASRDHEGRMRYPKFQQYPIRWMGFTFWKDCREIYSLENHFHRILEEEPLVTEEMMMDVVENLVNSRLPKGQSPWELYMIENFKRKGDFCLIFKVHHCLVDGFGMMTAIVDGLFENPQCSFPKVHALKEKSSLEIFRFCWSSFWEMSYVFSQNLRNCRWTVPDEKKEWHQVCARSEPVPTQDVKDIAHKYEVSLTSLLWAAISQAMWKSSKSLSMILEAGEGVDEKTVYCTSAVPAFGMTERKILSNHVAALNFDLPVEGYDGDPQKHIVKIHQVLESRRHSVMATAAQIFLILIGSHLSIVTRAFSKNKIVAVALTNFRGATNVSGMNDKVICYHASCAAGGANGDMGVVVHVLGHGKNLTVQVTAEKALMSAEEVKKFVKYIEQEILYYRDCAFKIL